MGNRPTIVIADSDQNFLVYMATLFNRMNFEVVPVDDVRGAYDLCRIIHPNLILLSCGEDRSLGKELLDSLHADNLLTKIPVIMVADDTLDSELFFASGCSDFLTKPVDLTHLHVSLQKCLPNRNGMRRHIRAPFNQQVSFTFAGLEVRCFAVTLSEGGIYLRTTKPLPVGSRVRVAIPVESGDGIEVNGEVAYTMGLLRGQFLVPPGMAIRFDSLSGDEAACLNQEVCRLLIGDIVDEQVDPVFKGDTD